MISVDSSGSVISFWYLSCFSQYWLVIFFFSFVFSDLIVQAKSGTGKTCVFSTIALDSLVLENLSTQVSVAQDPKEGMLYGLYHRLDAIPVPPERQKR